MLLHQLAKYVHDNFTSVTAVLQLLTTIAVGLVPLYVYLYTRRKDKLEFFYNNWNKHQDVNLAQLNNDDLLRAFEELIYGPNQQFDLKAARAFFLAFLVLNEIQNNFQAMKQGVLSRKEYLAMSMPSLRLFVRDKEMITYLLLERGYGEDFRESVLKCLHSLTPYNPPPFTPEGRVDFTPKPVHPAASAPSRSSDHGPVSPPYNLITYLYGAFRPFLDGPFFNAITYSFILNPILLALQLYRVVSSGETSGLSPLMFGGFALLNVLTALAGIKLRNNAMFLAFVLSFVLSMMILVVIVVAHAFR